MMGCDSAADTQAIAAADARTQVEADVAKPVHGAHPSANGHPGRSDGSSDYAFALERASAVPDRHTDPEADA